MKRESEERICGCCGKPFKTNIPNKIYCSTECSRTINNRKASEWQRKHSKNYEKKCTICGKTFISEYGNRKYCSDECKEAGARILKKTRKKWTPKEKKLTAYDVCRGRKCPFYGSTYTCDYLIMTGEVRGVPVEDCEHWKEDWHGKRAESLFWV